MSREQTLKRRMDGRVGRLGLCFSLAQMPTHLPNFHCLGQFSRAITPGQRHQAIPKSQDLIQVAVHNLLLLSFVLQCSVKVTDDSHVHQCFQCASLKKTRQRSNQRLLLKPVRLIQSYVTMKDSRLDWTGVTVQMYIWGRVCYSLFGIVFFLDTRYQYILGSWYMVASVCSECIYIVGSAFHRLEAAVKLSLVLYKGGYKLQLFLYACHVFTCLFCFIPQHGAIIISWVWWDMINLLMLSVKV